MYAIARSFKPLINQGLFRQSLINNVQTSPFMTESLIIAATTAVGSAVFTKAFYKPGSANTLIWKTGMGIKDTQISRNA